MCRSLIATVLLLLSVGGILLQELSVSEANTIIERLQDCKCVKDYNCDSDNYINPFIMNLGPRLARTKFPKIECKGDRMQCCKLIATDDTTNTIKKNQDPEVTPSPSVTSHNCGAIRSTITIRASNPNRAVTEETAMDGEFPWLTAIFRRELSGSYEFQCGGTLIHPRVVLTAYHCVYKKRPSDVLVRANGKKELPTKESDTRYVSEIVKHPRYLRYPRLYYDAALLFLDSPFAIEGNLNTLCLPNTNPTISFDGCIVAGWGDINGRRNTILKRIEVPSINRTRCEQLLRNTDIGPNFSLHKSFMCAGAEEGQDACLRDGGGPLMCEVPSEPDRYFQAGIVSWGVGCGQKNIPGVYANVETVSDWISSEFAQRKLDI